MELTRKILLAGRHPSAALDWLRLRWAGWNLRRSGSLGDTAFAPRVVSVNLTSRCNLHCRMCGQWRREDWNRAEVLAAGDLLKIFSELRPGRTKIYIWGGEPLLYPHFRELLAGLNRQRHYVVVNTNAVLLEKFAADLVVNRVSGIDVSVDGPAAVHDRIRGVEGTFGRMLMGANRVKELKMSAGLSRPLVKAVSVISEANQDHLEETVAVLEESGAFEALIFNLGWFADEERGEATRRLFHRCFDCEASSWKAYVSALGRVDHARVAEFRRKVSTRTNARLPVFFIPSISPALIGDYYLRPSNIFGRKRCVSPWLQAEIRADGGVAFCPDFPDYIAGNIKSEPLLKIWNGPKAIRFRQALRERGLFPICNRCCGLFSY